MNVEQTAQPLLQTTNEVNNICNLELKHLNVKLKHLNVKLEV